MAVLFPPLEPIAEESGRELKLGKFPNRRYDDRNKASATVRGFGSLPFGISLQISFGVVTDQEVSDVWLAWDAVKGDYGALELPDKFFFGIRPSLLAKIPSNIEWHFAPEMPKYSSVGPGYSRLEPITFIAQLAFRSTALLISQLSGAATGRGRLVGNLSAAVPPVSLLSGAATGRGKLVGNLSGVVPPVSLLSGAATGRGVLYGSLSGPIPVSNIVYSQSSVLAGAAAAINANMTNRSYIDSGTATGYTSGSAEWIMMDLGEERSVGTIVIGTATSYIAGLDSNFTSSRQVRYSSSPSFNSGTVAFTTPLYSIDGIFSYPVSFTARYIFFGSPVNGQISAISEFYALAPGQVYP